MAIENLNTGHFFVGVTVFIVTLLSVIFFIIVRPSYTSQRYNFSPFPTVEPKDIPNVNISAITTCTKELKKCEPGKGDCDLCGDGFECTQVDNEEVVVNGLKVPPGTWCLPGGKDDLGCGTYTGRAVWSDRQDGTTVKQKWSCVCLYPSLFGGNDCMTQLACKDNNSTIDQTANILQSADGTTWDPSNPNFNPGNTTPYDMDENGNPKYTCTCGAKGSDSNPDTDGVTFVRMPNDPYRCHLEPCTVKHNTQMWNSDNYTCDCKTGGVNVGAYVHSNVTGQCLNQTDFNGCSWNYDKNECSCPGSGPITLVPETCKSDTMTRSSYTSSTPCPLNPGGSFCDNPCSPNGIPYCKNGGICTLVDNKASCRCVDSNTTHFSGDQCEKSCFKNGTLVTSGGHNHSCCSDWAEDSCGAAPCVRYRCQSDDSSCFIAGTLILMADGTSKEIQNVKKGEYVMSARGGKTRVVIADDEVLTGNRRLIGFNGLTPFATEDHCFVDPKGKRTVVNPVMAKSNRHWSETTSMKACSLLVDEEGCVVEIGDIDFFHPDESTPLFDLITEDHTYIANGFKVFDDFVPVEENPHIGLVILEILLMCRDMTGSKEKMKEVTPEIVKKHLSSALNIVKQKNIARESVLDSIPKLLEEFGTMVTGNKSLLYLGSEIWRKYFHVIKNSL